MVPATQLGEDVERFRLEVRSFLEHDAPARGRFQSLADRTGPTAELYAALGERGWLSLCWPEEHGGRALPATYEFVLWDEISYARAGRMSLAAGIIAKTLIRHGTAAQQEALLPGIRLGRTTLALGYSEPEAGSDLTGLRTRARPEGAGYVVSGEKRWTSDAHSSDYLWLLARTGTQEERGRALSLFFVRMDSPGISISPIETFDGHRLNEVRLDDVYVAADARIGAENGAWVIMQEALGYERHLQLLPGRVRRDLEDLFAWADDGDRWGDAHVRALLAELSAEAEALEAHFLTLLADVVAGRDAASSAARNKLLGTTLLQRIARAPFELGDRGALVAGSPFEFLWRSCIQETIAGGTSEIMRGILARHQLGLGASQ